MSEGLRTEIIENQKARIDLVKWKLVIVAAVVVWSLDKLDKSASDLKPLSFWALSLVPFVCLFVDCQCFHINLRTFVISKFLRLNPEEKGTQQPYEEFVHRLRVEAIGQIDRKSDASPCRIPTAFCALRPPDVG
jgi:hypothetical protein